MDGRNYILQLGHAPSPAVLNTASTRLESRALAQVLHAGTSLNALRIALATGHAYAGTSESICGRISSRTTQWEETKGTHARRLCVHDSPIEWSMASTTCIIRPSVDVHASSGCGSSRRGQGDRGRVPTGPKRYQTNALRMRTGDGAPCRTRGVI